MLSYKLICFLGFDAIYLQQFCLSGEKAVLLESENLFMKLKLQKLEFELESEKIKCRHFEGLSQIAMMELQSGNWVNSMDKSRKLGNLLVQFQAGMKQFELAKAEMVNCVSKLENLICSINTILQ